MGKSFSEPGTIFGPEEILLGAVPCASVLEVNSFPDWEIVGFGHVSLEFSNSDRLGVVGVQFIEHLSPLVVNSGAVSSLNGEGKNGSNADEESKSHIFN